MKPPAVPESPGLDRRRTDTKHFSDLDEGPFVAVDEHHRDPLALREPTQRTRQGGLDPRLGPLDAGPERGARRRRRRLCPTRNK
jgi:hypothetical protein